MIRTLLLGLLCYAGLVAFFYGNQRAFLFPAPATVSQPGPDVQVVTVTAEDGQQVRGWFFAPAHRQSPVIVFSRGNAGTLSARETWARDWQTTGYGVLLTGYRGYDGESGSPSEEGLYADARAQISWLIGAGYPQIVFHGESLGTGIAIQMATEFQARAVVLEAPYASIPEVAAWHYPFLPVRLLMQDHFDSVSKISRIKAPLFIVHGTADTIVPIISAQKLFTAAMDPKEAHWIAGTNHNDLYAHGAARLIRDFLLTHTSGSPPVGR